MRLSTSGWKEPRPLDMKENFNFHRFDPSIPSFCCKCKICIVDEVLMKNVSAMTFLLNFFLCIILECNSDELKNDNSFMFPCWFQKSYLNTNTQLHIHIYTKIKIHVSAVFQFDLQKTYFRQLNFTRSESGNWKKWQKYEEALYNVDLYNLIWFLGKSIQKNK